ncbi:hypothetical protein Q1695_003767 [Nippostrongylus brasiliensis]|nr:hypothetical protein Q1695_003767 [Nippostrongylus brasiliensis]
MLLKVYTLCFLVKISYQSDQNDTLAEICEENEILTDCGTQCEPTCIEQFPECNGGCAVNVCRCKQGFIRRELEGPCIEEHSCPPASEQPPPTCDGVVCEENTHCEVVDINCANAPLSYSPSTLSSLSKTRFIRQHAGRIDSPSRGWIDCPSSSRQEICSANFPDRSCPANEMPTDCGTNCEPTCTKPNPGACISTCKPDACECKQGYYRNSKKACVKDCAGEPCQANEKRVNANSTCEPTCSLRDPYQNKNMCPKTVVKNVCRCKKGHIRQYDDGPCIPYKQCPPASACDNVSCDAGTICQQKPTYCKTPPCALSQPKCVPATSCDTVTCPPGRVCQVIIAECPVVVHPCPPPTPQCVIDHS